MSLRVRHVQALGIRNILIGHGLNNEFQSLSGLPSLFFSLHHILTDKVLYVSELSRNDPDPDFGPISLSKYSNGAECVLCCRIWARNFENERWSLVCFSRIDLENAAPVHQTYSHSFPANTIIIKAHEKHYIAGAKDLFITGAINSTSTTRGGIVDMQATTTYQYNSIGTDDKLQRIPPKISGESFQRPTISYNYDTLRAISAATRSLQEITLSTRQVQDKVCGYLKKDILFPKSRPHASQALRHALNVQTQRNLTLANQVSRKQKALEMMKAKLSQSGPTISSHLQFCDVPKSLETVLPSLAAETRRMVGQISSVIPIKFSGPLCFTVAGIPVPESIEEMQRVCAAHKPSRFSIDQINAALGLFAQVVAALMVISHDTHFRYLPLPRGSRSLVWDTLASPENAFEPLFFDTQHDQVTVSRLKSVDFALDASVSRLDNALRNLNHTCKILLDVIVTQACGLDGPVISNCIPRECKDNILWNIYCLILFVTSSPCQA